MLKIVIFIILILISSTTFAQITFSEIMFDVSTSEYHDEYVEIFNLSLSDTLDITGWQFSDSVGVDEIIPVNGNFKLAPQSFAVILDGSYFGNSTVYDTIIPPDVLILKVSDNSLGSSGLANTKAEYLSIIDSTGDTLATYRYSIGNTQGFSDEKIILDGDNNPLNWADCLIEGGTPGSKNSVSPRDYDVGLDEYSLQLPTLLFENDTVSFQIVVYNYGLQPVNDSIEISLYSDRNDNYLFDSGDILIIDSKVQVYLPVTQATDTLYFEWKNLPAGQHSLILNMGYFADENDLNNSITKQVSIIVRKSTLHLNEIKYLIFTDEPEWIEIFNSGNEKLFLKGWGITDINDTAYIDSSVFIYPNQYKVLSADTINQFYDIEDSLVLILDNFPTLNDGGDDISLIEPGGGWRERVVFTKDWLEDYEAQKVSLERINSHLYENKSENWGPSQSNFGATPGEQNSIFMDISDIKMSIDVRPNPFSPDGDSFDDYTIINGELAEKSARIKIQIFDIKGRLIRTLRDNQFSGNTFNLVWDGKNENGKLARMGIYIIFVQALNDRSGVIKEMKTTVVLAQKL